MRKLASHTAGPKSEEDTFPNHVQYRSYCKGGLCRFHSPIRVSQLCSKLVDALNGMGRKYDSAAQMVRDDLLLRFGIFHAGARQVTYEYYLLTSAVFRGGRQPAQQSYCSMDIVRQESGSQNNVLLKIAQQPHVQQSKTWPSPLERGSDEASGCPVTLSTMKLAARLSQLKLETRLSDEYPHKIVIRKIKFTDVSRSLLQVTGRDATWNPILVEVPVDNQAGSLVEKSSGAARGARAQTRNKTGEIDMLSCGFDLGLDLDLAIANPEPQVLEAEPEPTDQIDDHSVNDPTPPCREEIIEQLLAALDVQVNSEEYLDVGSSTANQKGVDDYRGLLGQDELAVLEEIDKNFSTKEPAAFVEDPQAQDAS